MPPAPERHSDSSGRVKAGVCLGLSVVGVVAGLTGPAQAQVQVQVQAPPEQPHSLRDSIASGGSAEKRFTLSHVNDSMPGLLNPIVPANDRAPGMTRADDDGWTAELRQEFVATQGADQWVMATRYSMLTQRGAWEPLSPEYRSLRTDLLEIGLQRNWKQPLGEHTNLVYGVGGGVQSLGPLGGHWLQQSFHIHGGFGGRLDPVLQHVYSTDSPTVYPLLSAGAGIYQRLDMDGQWTAKGTVGATLPIGPGLSTARVEAGLEYRPWSRVTFDAGVNVSAVHSNHRALDFMDVNGVRPGAYVGAEVKVVHGINAFARVETQGVRSEPVYMIGFSIGGGPRPWLNPLW
ncbi:hypothetical protein IV102_00735 [bacterium]|nr:hypothetical protein [bacterium]